MFATEPTMVRLPAKVVESASTFHINAGSLERGIHFSATSTNGTLEKHSSPPQKTTPNSKPELSRPSQRVVENADKLRRANQHHLIRRPQQIAQQKIPGD